MYILAAIDNSRIREILPLLRPRSAEPTLFSQTVFYLLVAGLASLVVLYFVRRFLLRRRRHREFLEYGHKLGLQDSEILFLRKIGLREKMKNPLRLLTSVTMFDRHVGAFAGRLAAKNLEHPLLDDIASIRQALNFDAVPEAKALNSTRQIEKGQSLLAWQGPDIVEGFSPWLVVKRNEGALPLVPILEGDRGYFADLKVGDPISARFWRQGDTEYRFDTRVARVEAGGAYLLHHADVERLQQRDFFRIDVDFAITLYAIPPDIEESESRAGSETSVTEGGRVDPGAARAEEEAAVALLDQEEDDGSQHPLEESEPPASVTDIPFGPEEVGGEGLLELESTRRIDATVTNISAGGLGVIVHGELPPEDRWLVDPAFEGSFPLASVVCRVLGGPKGSNVKLRFEDLAPQAEADIVRMVYQHQLLGADGLHGHSTAHPPNDPRTAPSD